METQIGLVDTALEQELSRDGIYLHEEVGRGATARVLRAGMRFHGLERPVALKQFFLDRSESEDGRTAARALWSVEARWLSYIHHSAVPSLLRAGTIESGAPYLLLDWVDGQTVRALRHARVGAAPKPGVHVLPERVAVHLACEVLRGLSAVQRAVPRLVHHDVNPTNLMVSREGEVKLLDFGSAAMAGPLYSEKRRVVRGKLGYMAPECFIGPLLDERADQFSLGVVLYELLAGVRPWTASSFGSETDCMLARKGAPLLDLRPHLNVSLAQAIERMMAHWPHQRFATPDDALRALAPFGAGELGQPRLRAIVTAIAAQ